MPRGGLRERAPAAQERRHALLTARGVVPVDEVRERVEHDVLDERSRESEAPRIDADSSAYFVERESERRAVRGVERESERTPRRSARKGLAEKRDVRVVAAEDPAVERLQQPPRGRRGGSGKGGAAAQRQFASAATVPRRSRPP